MEPLLVSPSKREGCGEGKTLVNALTPIRSGGASSGAPSPLSKANTPQRSSAGPRHALDDQLDAAADKESVAVDPPPPPASLSPGVSAKCSLLKWAQGAHARSAEAVSDVSGQQQGESEREHVLHDGSQLRQRLRKKYAGAVHARKARWFGEYSEEDPEEYLLMQDLIALHKRGAEEVSVTFITDDEPYDVSPLVPTMWKCKTRTS